MTVGIGVLATSAAGREGKKIPDTIVLMADTMGSYEDADSLARLHKAYMFPNIGMFAVGAGQPDRAGELLASFDKFLGRVPKSERSLGAIMRTMATVCYGYKREKFIVHEFPKLRLPPEDLDPATTTPQLEAKVQKAWEKFSLECDLIIGVFGGHGEAYLIQVNGATLDVENMTIPGTAAIGTGGDAAAFWLSRRQQTMGNPPLRSAYHAYEAKIMGEASAHVNQHLDIIVAVDGDFWFSTSHVSAHPYKKHPEINLENLKQMWTKYGPQDTTQITT